MQLNGTGPPRIFTQSISRTMLAAIALLAAEYYHDYFCCPLRTIHHWQRHWNFDLEWQQRRDGYSIAADIDGCFDWAVAVVATPMAAVTVAVAAAVPWLRADISYCVNCCSHPRNYHHCRLCAALATNHSDSDLECCCSSMLNVWSCSIHCR